MLLFSFKDEFRSGFNGNNMMYYVGQEGPILNQPITSMLLNERPHNCNTSESQIFKKKFHLCITLIMNQ